MGNYFIDKRKKQTKMLRTASLAAIVAMAPAYNTQAGLGLSLTQNGITSGKNVAVPLIFNQTQNLQIPDFSSDGLSMTNIVASASAPDNLDDIDITLGAAANSIGLSSTGVGAHITADFSYKFLISTISGS